MKTMQTSSRNPLGGFFRALCALLLLANHSVTALAGVVEAPFLNVSNNGTPTSSDSTVHFGTVAKGVLASTPRTFSLSNIGQDVLTVSSVRCLGGNASDFVLGSVPPGLQLAPGESHTFTVTPKPLSTGSRSTTLKIVSNHQNEPGSEFNMVLTATSVTGVPIKFGAAEYKVGQTASVAKVTLTRTSASLAQSNRIQTSDGSISSIPRIDAGLAGVDYISSDILVSFAVGQFSKTVSLQLIPNSTPEQQNRRFNASLHSPAGGATIGTQSTTSILILATDAIKPTLEVVTPSATAKIIDARYFLGMLVSG